MNKPHKHAALIHAWADGAEIEVLHGGRWVETVSPNWYECREYRIKPKVEQRRYRVALMKIAGIFVTDTVGEECEAERTESMSSFHSWLTDWVEYEIEVQP